MFKRYIRFIWVLIFIIPHFGWATVSSKSSVSHEEPLIIWAEFGIYGESNDGATTFTPTRVIPLQAGMRYGWSIKLSTTKKRIKWKEELILPEKPGSWGSGEDVGKQTLSEDKKTSIIEREVEAESGFVFNAWDIVDGDPAGEYVIRIFIEDKFIKEFKFTVKKD